MPRLRAGGEIELGGKRPAAEDGSDSATSGAPHASTRAMEIFVRDKGIVEN